jgi:hypothetical protein
MRRGEEPTRQNFGVNWRDIIRVVAGTNRVEFERMKAILIPVNGSSTTDLCFAENPFN